MRFGSDDLPTKLDNINNEDFICEIENRRVLWDCFDEHYNNRNERRNAWESIVRKYVPDFDNKTPVEREALCFSVQKKWKNIRTCYVREIKVRKDENKVGAKKKRSTYIYFELLTFLDPITKSRDQTASQVDEECWMDLEDFKFDPLTSEGTSPIPPEFVSTTGCQQNIKQELNIEVPASVPSSTNLALDKEPDEEIAQYGISRRKRKEKEADEDELLQLLKKKVIDHEIRSGAEDADEDRMFLLSLVSELRKVPSDVKLRVKSDIIMAIVNGQNYLRYGLPSHPLISEPHNNSFSTSNLSTEEDGSLHLNSRCAPRKTTRKMKQMGSASSRLTSNQDEGLVLSDSSQTAGAYVGTID